MKLTAEMLRRIAMASPNAKIVALIIDGINSYGEVVSISLTCWPIISLVLHWKVVDSRARLKT
ncbi:hypothetical protein [Phyllobacterium ifriqiyense]|uniref:hypothetical protein n=1 Tax=Phyllobacterium ifriqiyense TaxID=314238 RepID=UPI003F9B849F